MSTPQSKQLAIDLRRMMYMAQITTKFTEWLRAGKVCPSGLRQRCISTENNLRALTRDIMMQLDKEDAAFLKKDLTKDQLNDIANLIDLVANIENIGDIVTAIATVKKETVETNY